MTLNADPKPGRWILPLVVVGMVAFTFFFVSALQPAEDEPDESGGASGATTSTTVAISDDGDGSAPDDTLPTDVQAFVDEVTAQEAAAAQIEADMVETNRAWDADEVSFSATVDAIEAIIGETQAFRDDVELPGPPTGYPELADGHSDMLAAATDMVVNAEAVLTGLRAPDTGEARRAALSDFQGSVDQFNDAAVRTRNAATQ